MKRLVLCILALLPLILPYRSEAVVPVLMYHHIAGNGDISVTISPELFSAQMAALQDNGFTAVTFDELYDFAVGNGELPDHPVAIVFDDGYRSVWDHAFRRSESAGCARPSVSSAGVSGRELLTV